MEGFNGAVLRVKLKHLKDWTESRKSIAARYREGIKLAGLQLPPKIEGATEVYHQFSVLYPERDALVKHLNDSGVATGLFYPNPLAYQPVYAHLGYKEGDLPNTEKACSEVINLPVFPEMTDEQVDYVIETINSFGK